MADQLGAKAAAREDVSDEVDLFAPRETDAPDTATSTTGAPSIDHDDEPGEPDTSSGRSVARSTSSPAKSRATGSEPASRASNGSGDQMGMMSRLRTRPRGQLRARKVQRIVRRVDPWSVLKVSLLFYFCVWVMAMVSLVLVWGVAMSSGTVGSLESFIAEFLAFEEFSFNGDQLFQIFALGGLIAVFVATATTAVLAVLFNLIADLTGGIRFTVIEEESTRRLVNRGDANPR